VYNRNNYNNDALDLDGCHDVVVTDIMADSDDDAITLKSTSPRMCENIVIHDCIVSSHCNAIKLGTETNGGFRNINISNCVVKPSADQSSQFFGDPSKRGTSAISLEIVDGGTLENVNISNIMAEGTESPIFIRLGNRARGYAEGVPVNKVGTIRGVRLSNITVTGAGRTGCSITGLPGHPVEDIWLSNITIRQQGGCQRVAIPADEKEKDYPEATMWGVLPAKGFFVRHARNVNFHQVVITTDKPDKRPEYVQVDVEHSDTPPLSSEEQVQDCLMQMLARFTTYMKADYQPCQEPNSVGEPCGCFRSGSTMKSNEDGVRTNADLGMVCAFLCKYGRDKLTLPEGVSWDDLERMARQSLVFAYSTHKANRLKICADGRYWGSVSERDHVWESSLWAMSVAYSAHFQWEKLTPQQRHYIYRMLKAECNYELERAVPTGYLGDTKAEENGWEADVLAATLALFPTDSLASAWYERLQLFALNSYSHPSDANDTTVVDSRHGQKRVCDLYQGANLYPDYTLQNHNYFHTSYQNVVIQELGEAALILSLTANPWGGSATLWHHCREVCDSVLWWLALNDGELAMPNGNDWSLLLYDQITSYATMACLLRDADALMLERRACEMIRHRQFTTPDGSWLLRSDIGARRMGVQAHRVMMTWLMHHVWPTANLHPSTWKSFRQRFAQARMLPCQNIVRASTNDHFTCFGWSEGLKSYTGYIAPHPVASPDATGEWQSPYLSNLIVPYKANNTGSLLGWYEVEGRRTNAEPAEPPVILLNGNEWTLQGHLLCNDATIDLRFTLHSTDGNALVYTDTVRAREDLTIRCEKGGLTAISEDESTSQHRHYYFGPGWVNIDNRFGIVNRSGKQMKLDAPRNNNSVLTALLYASYDDRTRHYHKGDIIDTRHIIYYSNVTRQQTEQLNHFELKQ
jgi:hypothetical protein